MTKRTTRKSKTSKRVTAALLLLGFPIILSVLPGALVIYAAIVYGFQGVVASLLAIMALGWIAACIMDRSYPEDGECRH